jgi:hypothetical protein
MDTINENKNVVKDGNCIERHQLVNYQFCPDKVTSDKFEKLKVSKTWVRA